jgi:dsRNA-specific ribonuclease
MNYSIPKITPKFKNFISSLLKRTDMNDSSISLYTDDKSMIEFRRAFTHKSYNSLFNLERLEFLGDGYVNLMAARYIRERFPKIIATHWLTPLHQSFTKKNGLYKVGLRENFIDHILYGDEMISIIQDKNREYNNDFRSMLEDSVEGLFGAIAVISMRHAPRGVGYTLSYLLFKEFNKINMSLDYHNVFEFGSILKEIYDPLGWKFENSVTTQALKGKTLYITNVYGYPLGDKTVRFENKKFITKKYGETEKISKEAACKDALYIFRTQYKIKENQPPIYTITVKNEEIEVNEPPIITNEFKEFIMKLLSHAKVNKKTIDIVTQEEYLIEFKLAFMHESYDQYYNSNLYHFVGIKTLDLIIDDYLFFNSTVGEKWLTIIKQNIVDKKKGYIFEFAETEKFGDFIMYGPKVKENLDRFPDKSGNTKYREILNNIFKSLMAVIMHVFDKVKGSGVGYAVAFNFFEYHMKDISLSEGANQNNRTKLKEIYDPLRWDYKQCISYVNDPDINPEKGQHVITIKGYPKFNKKKDPRNEIILATARGRTKDEATEKAAKIALEVLDKKYNIRGTPSDFGKKV